MKVAPQVILTRAEQKRLAGWSEGRKSPRRLMQRAKIVLCAAQGKTNREIAAELRTMPKTVSLWRKRFVVLRIAGIENDAPRTGRKPTTRNRVTRSIIEKTTQDAPLDAAQWSTRKLAKALGVSRAMVHRVWQAHGLTPHLTPTGESSANPNRAVRSTDVAGC